jgi:hypothetical protein
MIQSSIENVQPEERLNSEPNADNFSSAQVSANALVIGGFVKGDKVVWDSHFGYEIGYFLGEGVMMNTYLVDVCTGKITGECSYSKDEIHPYTNELIDFLNIKYGYEKRF